MGDLYGESCRPARLGGRIVPCYTIFHAKCLKLAQNAAKCLKLKLVQSAVRWRELVEPAQPAKCASKPRRTGGTRPFSGEQTKLCKRTAVIGRIGTRVGYLGTNRLRHVRRHPRSSCPSCPYVRRHPHSSSLQTVLPACPQTSPFVVSVLPVLSADIPVRRVRPVRHVRRSACPPCPQTSSFVKPADRPARMSADIPIRQACRPSCPHVHRHPHSSSPQTGSPAMSTDISIRHVCPPRPQTSSANAPPLPRLCG